MLDILYQDDYLVAINKPHGLLVHRSSIAADTSTFALQMLRDQIGRPVFPSHRLDRKTAGVLLFALDKATDRLAQALFYERKIDKRYLAIVRGYTEAEGTIDYPLKKDNGSLTGGLHRYRTLAHTEIELPSGKFATSRYSLVEVTPETGRMHQIRRHFAHILHPIIGDRPHGCNKQNKLWKERFGMDILLLHASSLSFEHPYDGSLININAQPQVEFLSVLDLLSLDLL